MFFFTSSLMGLMVILLLFVVFWGENSIQDYLYCSFYDIIVAKQLYRKLVSTIDLYIVYIYIQYINLL